MDQGPIVDQTLRSTAEGTVQPGSIVLGSDGHEVGTVTAVSPDSISIKKRGLLAGTVRIPRSLVRQAEEGRVELAIPAKEAGRR